MKTLIVCAANVCRSPAAEALWRAVASRKGLAATVDSAGLLARPGQPPSPMMLRLLEERGCALSVRSAMPFLRAAACRHELILVMEPVQQRQVVALAPELMGRVHLLGRWGQGAIVDPTGGSREDHEHCLERIAQAVDAWMERLALPAQAVRPRGTVMAARKTQAREPVHA